MTSTELRDLQALDAAHHLHPFTDHRAMHAMGTAVMVSGEGCWLKDATGRRLLDGIAGLWCVNVGYGRREIADAIHRQSIDLAYYCSFFITTTEPSIRLAARLAGIAPGRLHHALFSNSGSEANESALKIIRAWHRLRGQSGRWKILTREFAYHGVTLATTSMTGLASCYEPFSLPLPGFIHVPAPHPYAAGSPLPREEYGAWCISETRRIIEREGPATIAALFAEPVQGAGGVIVPPDGYLQALRNLYREYQILFVADEVITAFGRLGDWFASELWDLDPDLLCTAKGITSGYLPLGATLVSDEIAEDLVSAGYFAHGFTYSGHPTACAAALANLDLIERDRLIPRVRDEIGPLFQQRLRMLADHPAVAEIRGTGLIGALELAPDKGRTASSPSDALGVRPPARIREQGVIVRGIRDLIALSPPLIISPEEIDTLFEAVRRGLDRLAEE